MQYCASHGEFHDIPVDMIVKSWRETYGDDKVNGWIREHEARAAEREKIEDADPAFAGIK